MKKPVAGAGDTWTWTAIEANTKLPEKFKLRHYRARETLAWTSETR